MPAPRTQTAIVQCQKEEISSSTSLPLTVSHSASVPDLPSAKHVLIRVRAVALNPTDHKMVTHFTIPGGMVGCDFCGIVEESPSPETTSAFPPGTRVCGATFPYSPDDPNNGAFAQWVVSDYRLLLRVPGHWDDLQGAALGGVGWGTAGLAFYDPDALALQGRPSKPAARKEPVLVYGGATASGTMACQLLKLSGYSPIAVTSTTSASLAMEYGATGTAAYTSPTCVETIKSLAKGALIRNAYDCITNAESTAICFAAIARAGGRYACLEGLSEASKARRAIHTKEVMGFEALGNRIDFGSTTYTREANPRLFEVCADWAAEVQSILDAGLVKTHPLREITGKWDGIIDGLNMLKKGEIRGQKLLIQVETEESAV